MLSRLILTLINIFFPPLSVLILTGPYTDTLINCCLFLAGVIPSHIHGFYISCTYFHRKKKVRKGRWPGGEKSFIYDRRIWNGGAKDWEVEELREREDEKGRGKRRDGGVERRSSRRGYGYEGEIGRVGSRRDEVYEGGIDRKSSRRGNKYDGRNQVRDMPRETDCARGGSRRSCASYGGDRRSQRGDGADRRTILGEMSGRY